MRVASSLAMAATLLSPAAAIHSSCFDSNGFCVQIGVPQTTVSSRSGNLYMQMQASTSYSWVALGQGHGMAGANMFLMYTDGAGNVTVSTRYATGEVEPYAQTDTRITILEGTGISNNVMTANFVCENCNTWGTGSMDLSSSETEWMSAWKTGAPLDSTSQDASIQIHDNTGEFPVDLTAAVIASDSNPFVAANANSASNGTVLVSSTGGGGGGGNKDLLKVHGWIMASMFVMLYPLGTVIMPALHQWAIHGIIQIIAMIGMWVGYGYGHAAANKVDTLFDDCHQMIGAVVCAGLTVQPITGWLHHRYFVAHKTRGAISYGHIWYGRLLLGLGIVNGGLGISSANSSTKVVVAYAVLAGIWAVVFAVFSSISDYKKDRMRMKSDSDKGVAMNNYRAMGSSEDQRV
ncbi:integral membrane protein [Ceratocystis lukuohia]|uniref:DOMON domain-containing protein n=2 Tax=Ceratocystis TaxID=5157 RepID=A0A2C5WY21_9PEZI|nr:hypothetical protein CFIMG_004640RA [Ceratocystis fimbriata CBS 114723]